MFENKAEMLRQLDDLFARIKKLEGHKVVGVNATMLHMYEAKVEMERQRAEHLNARCAEMDVENQALRESIGRFEQIPGYVNPYDLADANLKSENEALGAKVRVKDKKLHALNDQITKLKRRRLQLEGVVADKTADINCLRKENVAETRKSADISRELRELERVIDEKNKYIEMLRGCSPEVLKRDNDRLVQELKECHRIRDKQADTIFDFQTKVKKVRVLNANQAETICDLTDKLKEYEGSGTQWSTAARLNMTESILEKRDQEKNQLVCDKAFLQDEAFRWEQRHRDVKSTLERKEYQLEAIKRELEKSVARKDWDEIRANTERLRKEIKVLHGANEYKKGEMNRLSLEHHDQKEEKERWRDRYLKKSNEYDMLRNNYNKLDTARDALVESYDKLRGELPQGEVYVLVYEYRKHMQLQVAGVFTSHQEVNKWLKLNKPVNDEATKVFIYTLDKGEL